MAATLRNNANGGMNGATVDYVSNNNATSGDDWDFIAIGTNGSLTFSNQKSRGALSYKFEVAGTVSDVKVEWQQFSAPSITYVRFYVYLPSLPSASFRFLELSDGTQLAWSFGLRNDGKISIRDANITSMNVSTLSVPVGRWVRLEARIVSSATVGSSVVKIFTEADSPYPAETMTSASSFNTAPNGTGIKVGRFGIVGSSVATYNYYLDDITMTDVGYPGPANPTQAPPLEWCSNADFGTNGTLLTAGNSGDASNRFFQTFSQTGQVSFSNAHAAHGGLSYQFQAVNGNSNMVTWQGLRTNTAATRFYLYMTAIPGQLQTIFQFIASGGAGYSELAWFSIDLTGKVAVTDATATTLWLSPAAISLNTWYRFEIFASVGATQNTGTIQAAYYTLDNGSAIASFNTSTADLGINPIGWARFGKIGPTSYATPFYIDDIGVVQNAAGFIGSYAAAPSPPATYSGIIPHLGWGRSL